VPVSSIQLLARNSNSGTDSALGGKKVKKIPINPSFPLPDAARSAAERPARCPYSIREILIKYST
jgi:hypothetical protein